MTKKHIINTNQAATQVVDHGNATWTLNEGVTIATNGTAGIMNISNFGYGDIKYKIAGTIETAKPNGESGIMDHGDGNVLEIAETGRIDASYAVSSMGNDFTVINDGTATGAQDAAFIFSGNNFRLENNAIISGDLAATRSVIIQTNEDVPLKGTILNGFDGSMDGSIVDLADNARVTVINKGHLEKSDAWSYAIDLGDGKDKLVNSGDIIGSVWLGEGNDIADLRKGTIAMGTVQGGTGNDRYIVDSAIVQAYEDVGGGTDTVVTSVDYALFDEMGGYIEILKAADKGKIDLIGNGLDNTLIGNTSKNILDGGVGDDILRGGKGQDVFVFEDGRGKDTIADFTNGQDRIDVSDWTGSDNFSDIKAMLKVKDDDLVIRSGSDQLVIQDMDKADLNAADFIF